MASETFTFYIQPWYRKSPYFEATKRHVCKSWGLYNHMLLPTLYDDPITEYEALQHDVTLWDVAVERCVEVRGPDAFDLVNLVTCRDLTKVEPMQARYVLLTAPWGGIVNDPVLLRLDRDRFWLALADSDALLYLAGVAGARGMDVSIFEADVAPMQIQGPRSKDVMRDLFGDAVADLRYYFCAEAEVDGIPVVISRTGWTGEVGYELYLQDASRGDQLFERVFQAGEPYGIRVIAPSEARRIEAGIFQLRLGHPERGHAAARERARAVRRVGPGRRLPRPPPPGGPATARGGSGKATHRSGPGATRPIGWAGSMHPSARRRVSASRDSI